MLLLLRMCILHYWHSRFIRWLYSKAQLGMFQYHMFFALVCRFFLPSSFCVVFSCVCGCFSSSTSEDRWEYMCCPLPVQEALVHLVGLLPTIPTVLKNQYKWIVLPGLNYTTEVKQRLENCKITSNIQSDVDLSTN